MSFRACPGDHPEDRDGSLTAVAAATDASVEAHGGSLHVSNLPGLGRKFTILLARRQRLSRN
ncbi:hypothetical protein SAMN02745121_07392 [Nannocystis exedens]|uniref:Uncharacterized protein n=1 Tax=Nannocystis exedens TaxID=54 RepID=A0A1I2GML7_9BACT|nr:hypothetical protein [Nannocystis exedens]PCC73643.1 hypothetical protein NAEX_06731 [Nannocystis exedens]SFF18249.1 hypothetical protein SAMN02745121_07392 [Nannocystis exedens]